jgi:ABC-type phosphate/phosphonate transport system substrate-binding protein
MKRTLLFVFLCSFCSNVFGANFRIAYDASSMSQFTKKDMLIATDIWMKELVKGSEHTLEFAYYDDMAKMSADFNADKLDFVTGFGLSFVKYFDTRQFDNGFGAGFLNGEPETFVVVVNAASSIKSWNDLKDKNIGIDENDAIVKLYIENKMYETFHTKSAKVSEFKNRQRALLNLFFDKIDATIVTNKTFSLLKELNPQLGQKLKIIEDTELIATSFGFFRKNLDAKMKADLMDISKKVQTDERGKQLLILYKTETITDTKVEDLKPIQKLYEKSLQIAKEAR